MMLSELALQPAPSPPAGSAPSWLWGTFSRRSITFYSGLEDSETRVLWLQTHGLAADFRFPPDRVPRAGRTTWSEFDDAELQRLLINEGGLSSTHWDGSRMNWFDWTSFQTHAKWAEPGDLRRVGDCVIEFAPSGAYVEDWRAQPSLAGPWIGLRLLTEQNLETGEVCHQGGGLIVCGDHAALVRGRPFPLPDARLMDAAVDHSRTELLATLQSFEASYAVRSSSGSPWIVQLSTNPLREGELLLDEDGFTVDGTMVIQRTAGQGVPIERRFTVDTLAAEVAFSPATQSTAPGVSWLARESDTLLLHARAAGPIALPLGSSLPGRTP